MCNSDQQDQAEQLTSEYGDIGQAISQHQSQIKNPFENYKLPFDYESMSKIIDEITQQNLGQVNTQAAGDMSRASTQTTEGLASQGVTGGSILNTAVDKSKNPILKNKYNLTEQLYGQGMQAKQGAMGEENKYNFGATQQKGQFDLANVENDLKKLFGIQGTIDSKSGLLGAYDNTTWMDDVFAGLNTLSGFIPGIGSLIGGGGKKGGTTPQTHSQYGGGTTVSSDIRLKENIEDTGEKTKDGIRIVDFNFKGESQRHRGVIAQEVEKVRPDLVSEMNGYLAVNYGGL